MGFDTKSILNKTKANFMNAGTSIKKNFETRKNDFSERKASIKKLDYNELKNLYERRTGKKAEILQKDFNTGQVINKRPMTRGELELRLQFNKKITKENLSAKTNAKKKKSNSKPKSVTINFKI